MAGMHGAPLQGNFPYSHGKLLRSRVVVVWCDIVMHVTFVTLHFMFLALDDDDGPVPDECLDARFRGP